LHAAGRLARGEAHDQHREADTGPDIQPAGVDALFDRYHGLDAEALQQRAAARDHQHGEDDAPHEQRR